MTAPWRSASVAPLTGSRQDGRRFLVLARLDGSAGPQVVEWKDGRFAPYPDAAWNGWTKGDDPAKAFVRVNAQRIGPDGALWLVDTGAPGIGNPVLPGGPRDFPIAWRRPHRAIRPPYGRGLARQCWPP